MNAQEINAANKKFYAERSSKTVERLLKPGIYKATLEVVRDEQSRMPIYHQEPIERVAERIETIRVDAIKEGAARGGLANKGDELTKFIEARVAETPDISCSQLITALKKADEPWLEEIEDGKILINKGRGPVKPVPLTALKDRLTRAKKKLRRPAR